MDAIARDRAGRPWSTGALVSTLLALAACTSGGGGTPGGNQGPDPVVVDFAIAYVKRPVPEMGMQQDVRQLLEFNEGSDLFVRERASPSSQEINVTGEITGGLGDVRDAEPSYDGTKVVFAMREPLIEGADEEDQPTWNIWEYDLPSRELRRVIPSDIIAEEGHDVAPHYLPDGRIVFASTRQRQARAILLDEGKPQFEAQDEDRREPAFVLHVMDADGSDIHQVSFNQSHDLDPAVLDDGRIVFSRWDNAGPQSEIHLYAMRPDGSGLELLYGAQSHMTGTNGSEVHFLDPRPMLNGQVLVRAQPFSAEDFGGQLLAVDTVNYVEDTQANLANTGVLSGPAQQPATPNEVITVAGPSPGGRYSSAFPVHDGTGRLLVSWNQCRLIDGEEIIPCTDELLTAGTLPAAPPLYGIWMYDPRDETQLPVVTPTEGWIFTDAVALQPVAPPPALPDRVAGLDFDSELATEGVGILDIRSVYDFDGADIAPAGIAALADPAVTTADERPARFLRIEKAVSLPDEDVRDFTGSAFGVTAAFGMRELLGYVMVEPDGSVRTKVPANVPFAVTVLDANGRRIGPRHDNWLQVRPGEELRCNGCHDPGNGLSHGRSDLFDDVNDGATSTGQPFPNTNPAFFADVGETMAQVRARISCQTDCAALTPRLDIMFEDVWTDPVAANRAPDPSFSWRYADLQTAAPTTADCMTGWRAGCRATIHYEQHIHPLWGKPRITFAADGVTVLADDTCTTCHAGATAAAGLDLADGASAAEPEHFNAYRELLATDEGQPEPVMLAGRADDSVRFFTIFAPGGTHSGRLTAAELKLVSEWLDLGAQYFNDPFVAPLD
jgi:hypothetical protein